MLRLILAIAATSILAACGGSGDVDDTPEAGAEQGTTYMTDYLPWPPEGKDIQTTESGLQYIVVREGDADGAAPEPRDRVVVDYEGRLPDGEKFDSSYDRGSPAVFGVTQVISGWTEGLQLMKTGAEYIFYIPSELAYGDNPGGGRPAGPLLFKVELNKVEKAPPPKEVSTQTWDAYTPWGKSEENVQSTPSGLQYVVIESGPEDGSPPNVSQMTVVHYEGRFDETGEVFDSSFARGEPAMFRPGEVIPGWTEALQMMRPGDRWLLHIPGDLAYGPLGRPPVIPPNAALNFEVELLDVLNIR